MLVRMTFLALSIASVHGRTPTGARHVRKQVSSARADESIWRVDCSDKHGAANRRQLGDRSKQPKSLMFSAFGHHGHLGLLPKRSQMIQFFIQPAHTLSASGCG